MFAKLRSSLTNAPPRSSPATTLLKSSNGPVLCVERAAAARHARRDVVEAGQRRRRLVERVQLARARHVHFEAQRGLVADVLDLIERAIRHLHHDAFRRDDGLAAFHRELQRAGLHDPPLARVAVHAPRRLSGRGPSRSTARTGSRRRRRSRPSPPGPRAARARRGASCAADARRSSPRTSPSATAPSAARPESTRGGGGGGATARLTEARLRAHERSAHEHNGCRERVTYSQRKLSADSRSPVPR